MFKSVKYEGFENHPEAKEFAELALRVLEDEVRTWTDLVEVEWDLIRNERTGWDVALVLRLDLGTAKGEVKGVLFLNDRLGDPRPLRQRMRNLWGKLLDELLAQQSRRMRAELEAAGVP